MKRRQLQAAGKDQLDRQQSYQELMLRSILDGSGLSPLGDNRAPDTFQINGAGDMSWGMKNTPKEETFLPEQQKQEAQTGGSNLRDFS